jgi:hypothetical protein
LEVGKTEKFDFNATFTDMKANTKNTSKVHCVSKVTGEEKRRVEGKSYDVFIIENVGSYPNLLNGAPMTFGGSGAYAPKLGWWIERDFKSTQRGVTTSEVKWTITKIELPDS